MTGAASDGCLASTGQDDRLRDAVRRAVAQYGPAVPTDPVALRTALRRDGTLPDPDVELLVTVAGSGVVPALRAGTPDDTMIDSATRTVQAHSPRLDEHTARRACAAFAAAIADDRPEVTWEPARRRPRRGVVLVAALVAMAVVAAVWLLLRTPEPSAGPDPVAETGQRYRALGATLLDGATGCVLGDPQPGQIEAVECAFDGWTMTLVTYDTQSRLAVARDAAVTPSDDAIRDVHTVEPDAAFALAETAAGRSTVYWDSTAPRPVSAVIATEGLDLAELVARYDSRGFAAVVRPEQPGRDFVSGELWQLADETTVDVDAVDCAPLPAAEVAARPAREVVRCTEPGGVVVEYVRVSTFAELNRQRAAATSEAGLVPGTLRNVGGWTVGGDTEDRGQFSEYVPADSGDAHIYYDREDTLCFAVMSHPDLTQDQLKAYWAE